MQTKINVFTDIAPYSRQNLYKVPTYNNLKNIPTGYVNIHLGGSWLVFLCL